MKTNLFMTGQPLADGPQTDLLALNPTCLLSDKPDPSGAAPKETVRHILLGSPEAIRQTIHLLHILRYAEPVLWSPVLRVEEPLVITPERGEAVSLLRRMV